MEKLLFIDIETTPAVAMVWSLFNQNISIDQILTPTSVLCFAAKWHDSKEVLYYRSQKQDGAEFDRMIRAAHKLLSEADAVCHFNGVSFDIPRLNTEFIRLKLQPPPPIQQIDLKKEIMSKFAMTSSKLAFVGPYLQIGEKVKNSGWDLWKGCLDGNKTSWEEMEKYNKQDVVLLEKLYTRTLPWIENHPNMNLFVKDSEPVCPNCGSKKLKSNGIRRAATYVYRRYQCVSCGKWARARTRDKTEPTAPIR